MKLPSRTVADMAAQYNFEKLERTVDSEPVTTLPTTDLYVGRRIVYVADATNGVHWDLVYDGVGSYPWKYLGGAPLVSLVGDGYFGTVAVANTWEDMAANMAPSVALPLVGDYDFGFGAGRIQNQVAAIAVQFAVFNAGNTGNTYSLYHGAQGGAFEGYTMTGSQRITGASGTWRMRELCTSTAASAFYSDNRWVGATPVRVG